MRLEQRLRHPAICYFYHPLLPHVFPVTAAIKIFSAVRFPRIRWASVQSQFRDFRDGACGLPPRFRVHRLYPLDRCESEHRNGLSFRFGFVCFRRYHCRIAGVGCAEVPSPPFQVQYSTFILLSLLIISWSSLVRTLSLLVPTATLYDPFDDFLELFHKTDIDTLIERILTIYIHDPHGSPTSTGMSTTPSAR